MLNLAVICIILRLADSFNISISTIMQRQRTSCNNNIGHSILIIIFKCILNVPVNLTFDIFDFRSWASE